jgi:hypothetical protein
MTSQKEYLELWLANLSAETTGSMACRVLPIPLRLANDEKCFIHIINPKAASFPKQQFNVHRHHIIPPSRD